MPDSLILESPAHPFSTAAQPASPLALIHREMREAERICNETRGEGDNGPTMQAYFRAQDRFIDAPVSSLADVLLKLETMVESEDFEAEIEEEPKLGYARAILNMLRDLRALSVGATPAFELASTAAPSLDVLAIHRAADKEVDEIYRHQHRISGALEVLDEIAGRICGDSFTDEKKVRFLLAVMNEANDGILRANDSLCGAIDPLNPTVLE